MNDLFAFWGCGTGVLRTAQPHIRILSGFFVGCSILLVPLQTISGIALLSVVSLIWIMLAAMPLKMHLRLIIAALILFFPYLIITPWISVDPSSSSPIQERIFVAGRIVLRSTSALFIAASTIATLTIQEFTGNLVRLPIPRPVAVLITQLVIQTVFLSEETSRIIGVLRLRGASGRKGLRIIFSFPVVWMVRILFRAERTSAAMIIRNYGMETSKKDIPLSLTITDKTFLISTISVLSASILLLIRIVR